MKPPAEGDGENPRKNTPAAGSKRPGNDDEHPVINLIMARTKRPRENDYLQRGTKPSISYCQYFCFMLVFIQLGALYYVYPFLAWDTKDFV